jgi:hypothetical protein
VLLRVTTWNIDHGGQDRGNDSDDQHRWNAALGLAATHFGGSNPYRVIFIQEAFLWKRLGRIKLFARATGTTAYRAAGINDLDLVAFVGPGLVVGDWQANLGHLRAPTLVVPVRPHVGGGLELTLVTTHLDPWSANARIEQILALNSFLRDDMVLLGGDINCIGPHDNEPPTAAIPDWQIPCHLTGGEIPKWDRRPTQLAEQAGWVDLAHQFGEHDVPTGGFGEPFPTVRFDQFWAGPHLAVQAANYHVHDHADFKAVSDHVPVTVTLSLDA